MIPPRKKCLWAKNNMEAVFLQKKNVLLIQLANIHFVFFSLLKYILSTNLQLIQISRILSCKQYIIHFIDKHKIEILTLIYIFFFMNQRVHTNQLRVSFFVVQFQVDILTCLLQ